MILGGDPAMWAILAAIGAIIILYATERYPIELVSVGAVAFFLVFFQVFPQPGMEPGTLLEGFANPALISILGLLVIGQGIFQTGALDTVSRRLTALYDARPTVTIVTVFALVFVISAFINNTPVVVMFIPVMAAIAHRRRRSPSRLMIPLSYICIMAGATTLIGSSTNLLVSDSLRQLEGVSLDFFDPAIPGLLLAAVGVLYLVTLGRLLLPHRATMESELSGSGGKQFIAQLEVTPGHPLEGKSAVAGLFPALPNVIVRMIQRGERALLPPFDNIELQTGDVVIMGATRTSLEELLSSHPEYMRGMIRSGDTALEEERGAPLVMSEGVVAPASRFAGRTIQQIGFRYQTGCLVLGVQRRSRMLRGRMEDIRLEAGDVLLLFGPESAMRSLRANRDVIVMEWATRDVPDVRRAWLARVIFAGVILAAATGVAPIVVAAVVGAAAMIATGCLNVRQAARSVDIRIFTLIGAAFAMGAALQATGGAVYLAGLVVAAAADYGPAVLLSALFLLVMLMTNIVSNSATAILFAPVAVSAASMVGADPRPFVLTVLFGANCCFITPIAYQTNLLVMGPGHYRFSDFLRVGGPLAILIWIAYSLFAPWYFGL